MIRFILLALLLCCVNALDKPPLVNLPHFGKIEGGHGSSFNNRHFYTFEGIPYARPPLGKYRFKEPVPVKPWNGVWQAKTIYKCMQYNEYTPPGEDFVIGDEDCLYVNVYTPTLNSNANLDVIVYIHGGAFMFLYGGAYGPRYIMDRDVVYVNLNYRLGPLGFLTTEDDVVSGNNGIRDQILALAWVKDNVKYFGGNPDSITLAGMSAGGASVHIHYLTEKSRGLFNRGLSQSGTSLNPWVLMEAGLEKTNKLAVNVGCRTVNAKETIDCLRKRPARQIVSSVAIFQPWLYNPFSPFGVVVDSWSSDSVLPDHPINLMKKGRLADLPWIISETNFEGLYPASDFLMDEKYLSEIDSRWNELLPFILDYNYTVLPTLRDGVSEKIREFYLGVKRVNRSTFPDFVRILSDRLFVVDIEKTAKLQASVTRSPVYFYYFTYRGADSWHQHLIGRHDDFGAAHAEDTAFIFSSWNVKRATAEDKAMVEFFLDLFTSYAKDGKPKVPVTWTPLSKNVKDPIAALKIDSPTKVAMVTPDWGEEDFWASLPIKENEKIYDSSFKDEL